MSLTTLADRLAPKLDRVQLAQLYKRLPDGASTDWCALATIAALTLADKRCIGISGGQGAGKSTLAELMVQAMALQGRRVAVCSLDDFYLPGHARRALAEAEHPLLATRGPPGTHDLELAVAVVQRILRGERTALPRFDKGRDEPEPSSRWPVVERLDVLLLEGWCLGVQPQPEALLAAPVNALEANEDGAGHWRRQVNDACGDYQALWRLVDWWIYIDVPDMAAVRQWRGEQELALPAAKRMSWSALERFVAHYERLTLWQKQSFSPQADWLIRLDRDHRVRPDGGG